ncbi:MAG: glycosyltransferase [Alphaproteobacteria bacterium]|nr:glycosyltransferase [Alphaproteobacteria bacterium]
MKILHIIDTTYFETHKKTISEFILALSHENIEQKIYTEMGTDIGWVKTLCDVENWKISKSEKLRTLSNKIKTWLLISSFRPDIIIKYGKNAREIAWETGGVQISFLNEKENLSTFENTDYIMTNTEDVLSFAKSHGYSGSRSFLLPPFMYMYDNNVPVEKRNYFIPEKAKIIYIAGTFLKNIGFERAFDSIGIVSDTYFFIVGSGPDEEYVKDYASKVNIKARSRFISEIEKSFISASVAEFAFLPFDDTELSKYILEAMMQKKLVITVKNSQSEEFVSDGKTGFFVSKNDNYLIKKKLKEIMNLSPEEKQKIADAGFEVAKNYLHTKIITGYIQTFKELIKKYNSRKNLLNN